MNFDHVHLPPTLSITTLSTFSSVPTQLWDFFSFSFYASSSACAIQLILGVGPPKSVVDISGDHINENWCSWQLSNDNSSLARGGISCPLPPLYWRVVSAWYESCILSCNRQVDMCNCPALPGAFPDAADHLWLLQSCCPLFFEDLHGWGWISLSHSGLNTSQSLFLHIGKLWVSVLTDLFYKENLS